MIVSIAAVLGMFGAAYWAAGWLGVSFAVLTSIAGVALMWIKGAFKPVDKS